MYNEKEGKLSQGDNETLNPSPPSAAKASNNRTERIKKVRRKGSAKITESTTHANSGPSRKYINHIVSSQMKAGVKCFHDNLRLMFQSQAKNPGSNEFEKGSDYKDVEVFIANKDLDTTLKNSSFAAQEGITAQDIITACFYFKAEQYKAKSIRNNFSPEVIKLLGNQEKAALLKDLASLCAPSIVFRGVDKEVNVVKYVSDGAIKEKEDNFRIHYTISYPDFSPSSDLYKRYMEFKKTLQNPQTSGLTEYSETLNYAQKEKWIGENLFLSTIKSALMVAVKKGDSLCLELPSCLQYGAELAPELEAIFVNTLFTLLGRFSIQGLRSKRVRLVSEESNGSQIKRILKATKDRLERKFGEEMLPEDALNYVYDNNIISYCTIPSAVSLAHEDSNANRVNRLLKNTKENLEKRSGEGRIDTDTLSYIHDNVVTFYSAPSVIGIEHCRDAGSKSTIHPTAFCLASMGMEQHYSSAITSKHTNRMEEVLCAVSPAIMGKYSDFNHHLLPKSQAEYYASSIISEEEWGKICKKLKVSKDKVVLVRDKLTKRAGFVVKHGEKAPRIKKRLVKNITSLLNLQRTDYTDSGNIAFGCESNTDRNMQVMKDNDTGTVEACVSFKQFAALRAAVATSKELPTEERDSLSATVRSKTKIKRSKERTRESTEFGLKKLTEISPKEESSTPAPESARVTRVVSTRNDFTKQRAATISIDSVNDKFFQKRSDTESQRALRQAQELARAQAEEEARVQAAEEIETRAREEKYARKAKEQQDAPLDCISIPKRREGQLTSTLSSRKLYSQEIVGYKQYSKVLQNNFTVEENATVAPAENIPSRKKLNKRGVQAHDRVVEIISLDTEEAIVSEIPLSKNELNKKELEPKQSKALYSPSKEAEAERVRRKVLQLSVSEREEDLPSVPEKALVEKIITHKPPMAPKEPRPRTAQRMANMRRARHVVATSVPTGVAEDNIEYRNRVIHSDTDNSQSALINLSDNSKSLLDNIVRTANTAKRVAPNKGRPESVVRELVESTDPIIKKYQNKYSPVPPSAPRASDTPPTPPSSPKTSDTLTPVPPSAPKTSGTLTPVPPSGSRISGAIPSGAEIRRGARKRRLAKRESTSNALASSQNLPQGDEATAKLADQIFNKVTQGMQHSSR